jgi:hypothetical protein
MLRDRLKAVRGYELPPIPKTKPRREEPKRGFHFNPIAPMRMDVGPRNDWIKKPDEKPEKRFRPSRKEMTSPLTLIAVKAPKKLVRTYQTAESLLAERTQPQQP